MTALSAPVAVRIPAGGVVLDGDLGLPAGAGGVVLFAHGSGSGRHSPRNRLVASRLRDAGFATLLLDLLTPEEERIDQATRALRFDVEMLARRLLSAVVWLERDARTATLPLALFGASTGAAAALVVAAWTGRRVGAVVSRGGRPDLAGDLLASVAAPTLLVVGGRDPAVARLNEEAAARLGGANELRVVPGATHLFEEPGALDAVAALAADWFRRHLPRPAREGRAAS
jgi:dienelactone hydrolase